MDSNASAQFYRYYEQESMTDEAWQRFDSIRAAVQRSTALPAGVLDVADIGCGAGTQCRLWAGLGHRVSGADINAELIALARQRATAAGMEIGFDVASATQLPWADGSQDLCLVPELLEHVADWRGCIREMARVLRPGGLLYLSTSNCLCPVQQEFDLPLYSWYPARLKRHYERLACTSRPELAGHAAFPALNWFSYRSLGRELEQLGFECRDRFDLIELEGRSRLARLAITALRRLPPLRFFGHMATPYLVLLGVKRRA
ncbi:class I SAM-dependent methyltransferase [Massilia sp. MB5]|uniref:class I SAM-dependent methyltransferase n=1 Tax=Massilia sp. MB5 TaxID=2919578 RepID=UPI001F0FF5EC|nr:class I SAM-dependent methyltransferase [Massilia sp. MB5]UMR29321.1 class I SAM-dependent methyltransferase [Massilia sp. MB5]